jgi:hypothetical protein
MTDRTQILYSAKIGSSSSDSQGHHLRRQADSFGNHGVSERMGVQHGPSCVEGCRIIQTREVARAARRTSIHLRSWIPDVCGKLVGEQRVVSRVYEDAKLLQD